MGFGKDGAVGQHPVPEATAQALNYETRDGGAGDGVCEREIGKQPESGVPFAKRRRLRLFIQRQGFESRFQQALSARTSRSGWPVCP